MARATETLLIERLERLLSPDRYIDVAARLRVWDLGPDGKPVRAELLPRIYGGRFDTLLGRYVGEPETVVEISCHRGQLPLLLHDEPGVARVLALGPPRGGKTRAAVIKALLLALDWPGKSIGLVAPTGDRRAILLETLNKVLGEAGASRWVKGYNATRKRFDLVTRAGFDIVAAAKASNARGNPLQGRDWWRAVVDEGQNVEDDSQVEIDSRGGAAGTSYCVFETATLQQIPGFRARLNAYRASPIHRIIRYDVGSNPWVQTAFYERLRGTMSERQYRELIQLDEQPPESRTYPKYDPAPGTGHIRARNWSQTDITAHVVRELYANRAAVEFIIAQDFGHAVNTSVILKCFLSVNGRDKEWWVIDEVITRATSADEHALALIKAGYEPGRSIVFADPHKNGSSVNTPIHISDYRQMARRGFDIHQAGKPPISKKHRVNMVNALLESADHIRRLFLLADDTGKFAVAAEVAKSLEFQENDDRGEPETERKGPFSMDHPTAALGYGLYKFERIRGGEIVALNSAGARAN